MITSLNLRNLIIFTLLVTVLFSQVACGQYTETVKNTYATGSSDAPAAVKQDSNLPAAPDFTLPAANKNNAEISLSSFQGEKDVVLVFYRAYW